MSDEGLCESDLPLSFAQQRLWFLDQLERGSSLYNVPLAVRLTGQLDVEALKRSFAELVRRHEVLRTTFPIVDGGAYLHIAQQLAISLPVIDVPEAEVQQRAEEEASKPFDLARGPLLRTTLLRLSLQEHVLLLTMHHIVSDGWSMGVLVREIGMIYEAFRAGRASPLQELTIQYADYAAWQRDWLSGEVLQAQLAYWNEQLRGSPAALELLTDRPRPPVQTYRGALVPVALPRELSQGLAALSRREGVTMYMTLLAAFSVLLHRYTGQDDIVVGSPIAGRTQPQTEGLIGFFVNTLVLRTDLSGKPSTRELLRRVREVTLGAYAHQDVPFEKLVEELSPRRDPSRSPLFQVMLALQNAPMGAPSLGDVSLALVEVAHTSAKFELTLSLQETAEGICGGLAYSTDLFDATTIERMVGHFTILLAAMVAQPDACIDELPLLTPIEHEQVLVGFNDTTADFPQDLCIHHLFELQAATTPDAVAVVFDALRLTYQQLNERANQLAHHLQGLGVGPEVLVGVCVERSLEMVVALLGILKAGGAYVPLDPTYPKERLAFMLADAAAPLLLTQERLLATLPEHGARVLALDTGWAPIAQESLDNPVGGAGPDNLAYIIYTSGSTGKPKGVMVEHRNVVNLVLDWQRRFGDTSVDRPLSSALWTNFGFDVSLFEIFVPFAQGGALHVIPEAVRTDPSALLVYLREQKIEQGYWPPFFIHYLKDVADADIASLHLRRLLVGVEPLPEADLCRLQTLLPALRIVNGYGPTESTVFSTTYSDIGNRARTTPIGRPIANTQIYILDPHLRLVPVGVTGEIHIGGAGVARGYLNRPELTLERFIPDPFSAEPDARMYRTGDLARWLPDGDLEYLGRMDHQVKIRGFRIELGEIESVLLQHPIVREAFVMAREDEPGDKRLVAYLVARDGPLPAVSELRAHLQGKLPEYMMPAAFVKLEALPLTPHGKLDRKSLPRPEGDAFARHTYEPPQGELEAAIAAIWSELLGVERVSRHDDFFALGGHSLLVPRLLARLRRAGWEINASDVFVAPVLNALAAVARGAQLEFPAPPNLIPEACTAIEPAMLPLVSLTQQEIDQVVSEVSGGTANVQDIYPLTAMQEGILYHHLASQKGDPYILSTVLRVDSRERLDQLLHALQHVIDRHDLLRSSVHWDGLSVPLQVVCRSALLPVQELQLSPKGEAVEQLLARIDPRTSCMNLRRAPLMAAYTAADPHSESWLVLLLMHHLTSDHIAQEIMLEEIVGHLHGHELPPPLPFRGFVAQTLAQARSGESEDFFRELLGDVNEPTTPFGLLDARSDGVGLREATGGLSPQLAQQVRETARGLGVSAAALFHVAWAMVVGHCAGRDDVVFGSVLSGRMQGTADAGRVFGMFINTLPVRVSLADAGAGEVVLRMHRQLAQLLRHEQASLAQVQRLSGVRPPLPLFTAMLNYRHSRTERAGDFAGIELIQSEERANYPFLLSVDDLGEGFTLKAQTVANIEPQRVVGFMQTALAALAGALECAQDTLPATLSILSEDEQQEALRSLRGKRVPLARDTCVHELFEAQALRTPNAVAVQHAEGELSYGELARQSSRLARWLRSRGVGPDRRVGLCVTRGPRMIVGLLAILKAGGAYVPLDPDNPAERLRHMVSQGSLTLLLSERSLHERCTQFLPVGVPLALLDEEEMERELALLSDAPLARAEGASPADLAYVIFTSGSTGAPKGATVPHRGFVNLMAWYDALCFERGADEAVLMLSNFSFDLTQKNVFTTLARGARLVLPAPGLFDPRTVCELIERLRVSVLNVTPSVFVSLLQDGDADRLRSLRNVVLGGEPIPYDRIKDWHRASGCRLVNSYGPTECTDVCSYWVQPPSEDAVLRVPLGIAVPNVDLYVLNEHQALVPQGVAGELCVGGVGVGRGYLGREDLTAQRFVANPFHDATDSASSERLYRTGDLVRRELDGTLHYLGRMDDQVKIRGFRIELGEVESVLVQHPAVREAVVVAREDAPGDKRLVAYLVGRQTPVPGVIELRSHLLGKLPEYMVPAAFVTLEAFPLTPNGKVDRRALPAAELFGAEQGNTYVAPRTPVEEVLVKIWSEVLHVDRIGVHDNFFELGGHSLVAVQVVTRVRRELGVELPLAVLLQHPTLQELAVELTVRNTAPQRCLVPISSNGDRSPLFLVHPVMGHVLCYGDLARALGNGQPIYGLQSVGLDGKQAPLGSVGEMAERYLREVRDKQPHGPYYLAGWSFGGLVAYEMACRLRSAGESVAMLGLIDTSASLPNDAVPQDDFDLMASLFEGVIEFDLAALRAMPRTDALRLVLLHAEKIGLFPSDADPEIAERLLIVAKSNRAAGCAYRAPRYDGELTLFVATESLVGEIADETLGWSDIMGSEIVVHKLAARHLTMVFQPQVEPLAALLRAALAPGGHIGSAQQQSVQSAAAL